MSVLSAEEVLESLTKTAKLCPYSDLSGSLNPVPKKGGIYAWYFKEIPPLVPTDKCVVRENKTLLYVGISPNGMKSNANLFKRIKNHRVSSGVGSTLRRSLNTVFYGQPFLSETNEKEQMNNWMKENAFVCWAERENPWEIEVEVITRSWLPLNIEHSSHPFSQKLKSMRNQN